MNIHIKVCSARLINLQITEGNEHARQDGSDNCVDRQTR